MKTLFNRIFRLFSDSVFLTLLFCHSSSAATQSSDSWQFQLTPYAWLAGMEGRVATLPSLPPSYIKIDFWDDVIGNIDGGVFLVGEARKGCYGVIMDVAYVDIEQEGSSPGPLFSSVSVGTESWMISAAGTYRLVDQPAVSLDLLAGIRYWSVDTILELLSGLLPGREFSYREDWVDPLIGVKGFSPFGDSKFFVSGNLAIGGFGAGSDFMWDVNANIGYQWSKMFSTTIGYRYLDVDYEDDGFLYDVAQQGPVMGLSWRF